MNAPVLPRIAIATGDPAGIGPEIAMKAAVSPAVTAICRPVVVGDPAIIDRQAKASGISHERRLIERVAEADWSSGVLHVLACRRPNLARLELGSVSAAAGEASLACAREAIRAALGGEVEAVVAAPQNQTSIALAKIVFDGYPSFVARETGLAPGNVFLMLCFGPTRIVHCTLHVSVSEALALITPQRVEHVIRVTDSTLKRLGVPTPRISVSGLNPHAGEDGLFGREEIEIIRPAIERAAADGIDVSGPFGADALFHQRAVDAFVVMLHDQGHIAAKLVAPRATAGLSIGSPILFSSVAHGSAHDIAGKGVADPGAMVEAITRLAGSAKPGGVSGGRPAAA